VKCTEIAFSRNTLFNPKYDKCPPRPAGELPQNTEKSRNRGMKGESSGVTRVLVTRGGNWGCHPYFFLKNWRPFLVISHFCSVTPIYFLIENWRPFCVHHCHFYWFYSVSPRTFLPVRPRFNCPLFFVNSPTKIIFFRSGVREKGKERREGEVAHPQKLSKVSAYVILFIPYFRCSSFLKYSMSIFSVSNSSGTEYWPQQYWHHVST